MFYATKEALIEYGTGCDIVFTEGKGWAYSITNELTCNTLTAWGSFTAYFFIATAVLYLSGFVFALVWSYIDEKKFKEVPNLFMVLYVRLIGARYRRNAVYTDSGDEHGYAGGLLSDGFPEFFSLFIYVFITFIVDIIAFLLASAVIVWKITLVLIAVYAVAKLLRTIRRLVKKFNKHIRKLHSKDSDSKYLVPDDYYEVESWIDRIGYDND